MTQKGCSNCGASFAQTRPWSKYCSKKCGVTARSRAYISTGKPAVWQYKSYAKRVYGLSLEDIEALRTLQKFKCKICGTPESALTGKKKRLCIDHDHSTGKVRGLLCETCNTMLGMAKDSRETLEAAIAYLGEHL